ncbi:MAG: ABC transporter ATP-binding protein [Spirochaetaceae bacterium]|nr:MAG: ABC transporter ATP-binding protein [Spirochaetaceae bacterium]
MRITDLGKSFGPVPALNGVSLSVRSGQLTGLVGSDGAGKTTLIRIVAGLLPADRGEVAFPSGSAGGRPPIGYLSQGFSLYGDLTIEENMRFFSELHGLRRYEKRSTELLELVGLAPFRRRRAGRLSGGMKKKLALACALVHRPELLLLDEPTTGVDPLSRREFWGILARLQQDGFAVLLSTPYFDEAERCTEVVLMHAGEVLHRGTPEAVMGSLEGVMLEVVCNPVRGARTALTSERGIDEIQLYGDRLHVLSRSVEIGELRETIQRCMNAAGVELIAMQEVSPGIENVFISRMKEAG